MCVLRPVPQSQLPNGRKRLRLRVLMPQSNQQNEHLLLLLRLSTFKDLLKLGILTKFAGLFYSIADAWDWMRIPPFPPLPTLTNYVHFILLCSVLFNSSTSCVLSVSLKFIFRSYFANEMWHHSGPSPNIATRWINLARVQSFLFFTEKCSSYDMERYLLNEAFSCTRNSDKPNSISEMPVEDIRNKHSCCNQDNRKGWRSNFDRWKLNENWSTS